MKTNLKSKYVVQTSSTYSLTNFWPVSHETEIPTGSDSQWTDESYWKNTENVSVGYKKVRLQYHLTLRV